MPRLHKRRIDNIINSFVTILGAIMPDIAISVKHLTKVYKLYDKPIDRLKEALNPFKKSYHKDFYALNDVSFDIKKGETVGIIGKNGAGKSTLLKIITGVLTPTSGSVQVHGKIASLLELGAGFNPDYTGLENVYFQGSLMGYTREEMEAKVDDILAFADIGEFIHQPVKTYSSGMFARLAFSVAINVEPDILIVDEALSVGDMKFQQKCFLRMKRLREKNTTILLVTHDMSSLRSFASHGIWIDDGKVRMTGESEKITNAYISFMTYDKTNTQTQVNDIKLQNIVSNDDKVFHPVDVNDYEIHDGATVMGTRFSILDELSDTSRTAKEYKGDEKVEYAFKVKFEKHVENLMIGIAIVDKKGIVVSHLNTMLYGEETSISISEGDEYVFAFRFNLPNLSKGYYSFYTNIVDGNYSLNVSLAMLNGVCGFEVFPAKHIFSELNGVVYLRNTNYFAEKLNCGL